MLCIIWLETYFTQELKCKCNCIASVQTVAQTQLLFSWQILKGIIELPSVKRKSVLLLIRKLDTNMSFLICIAFALHFDLFGKHTIKLVTLGAFVVVFP